LGKIRSILVVCEDKVLDGNAWRVAPESRFQQAEGAAVTPRHAFMASVVESFDGST